MSKSGRELIEELAKRLEDKGCKLTFGLQPNHIQVIEKHIGQYDGAKYSTTVWNDIGKEIGWDALTAALWYFRSQEGGGE